MFLNDGKVLFLLFEILFKFSWFNFCYFDSVCSGLFGCAVFGCVGFPFSEADGSFRMGCFYFLIFDVPTNESLPCWSFIFYYFKVRKPTLFHYCSD